MITTLFTKTFLLAALERAIKTTCQALIVVVGAAQFDVFTANWQSLASVAAAAFFLSVLTSVASEPFGPSGSPSVVTG
jgi:hypothetical protein